LQEHIVANPYQPSGMQKQHKTVTLGGGCFWCLEAIFQDVHGVTSVISGYAGGHVENPSYEEVCAGHTGHAEVIQVAFDPCVTSLEYLLEIFWTIHNPTTCNQQGADIGTQYRSIVFYTDDAQKITVENSKKNTDASDLWTNPIVTEISPLEHFYKAEDFHQDYYRSNPNQSYCQIVIRPKVEKFHKKFMSSDDE